MALPILSRTSFIFTLHTGNCILDARLTAASVFLHLPHQEAACLSPATLLIRGQLLNSSQTSDAEALLDFTCVKRNVNQKAQSGLAVGFAFKKQHSQKKQARLHLWYTRSSHNTEILCPIFEQYFIT